MCGGEVPFVRSRDMLRASFVRSSVLCSFVRSRVYGREACFAGEPGCLRGERNEENEISDVIPASQLPFAAFSIVF